MLSIMLIRKKIWSMFYAEYSQGTIKTCKIERTDNTLAQQVKNDEKNNLSALNTIQTTMTK